MTFLPKLVAILLVLTISAFFSISGVKCGPDVTLTFSQCNENSYPDNDPFANSVSYVINDLQNVTPNHENFDYYTNSPYAQAVAYGHGKCNSYMSAADCVTCLIAARADLFGPCQNKYGGNVELVDCSMRYEQYQFQ